MACEYADKVWALSHAMLRVLESSSSDKVTCNATTLIMARVIFLSKSAQNVDVYLRSVRARRSLGCRYLSDVLLPI